MNKSVLLLSIAVLIISALVMINDMSVKFILFMFAFSSLLAISLSIFNHVTHNKYDDVSDDI